MTLSPGFSFHDPLPIQVLAIFAGLALLLCALVGGTWGSTLRWRRLVGGVVALAAFTVIYVACVWLYYGGVDWRWQRTDLSFIYIPGSSGPVAGLLWLLSILVGYVSFRLVRSRR